MNKSNSPYIMNKFVILIIPISVWNVLLEKAIKVIFNFLDSNTTYTVKVIFTFPAEEIQKKTTPAKTSSIFENNISEY